MINNSYVKEIIKDKEVLGEFLDTVVDIKKDNKMVTEVILSLKETMKANNLVALCAPQIGYKYRIFCLKLDEKYITYINPRIVSGKGMQIAREICASFDGEYFRIRSSEVTVEYMTPLSAMNTAKFNGYAAFMVQQMEDFFNGILLPDIGFPVLEGYDDATPEEQEAIKSLYLESLDLMREDLESEIEKDPEAKQLQKAVEFINAVDSGKVKVEKRPFTEEEMQEARNLAKEYADEESTKGE